MQELEREVLHQFTPCRFDSIDEVARALAVVHTELVLIHPFRDGNGRTTRLLANLMALQAGLPSLNFSSLKGRKKKEYFAAIQTGLDRDYRLLKEIFSGVIRETLQRRKTY